MIAEIDQKAPQQPDQKKDGCLRNYLMGIDEMRRKISASIIFLSICSVVYCEPIGYVVGESSPSPIISRMYLADSPPQLTSFLRVDDVILYGITINGLTTYVTGRDENNLGALYFLTNSQTLSRMAETSNYGDDLTGIAIKNNTGYLVGFDASIANGAMYVVDMNHVPAN